MCPAASADESQALCHQVISAMCQWFDRCEMMDRRTCHLILDANTCGDVIAVRDACTLRSVCLPSLERLTCKTLFERRLDLDPSCMGQFREAEEKKSDRLLQL